jgi:copper(I)-binding protein
MKHPLFRLSALMLGLALILAACSSTNTDATPCDAVEIEGAWFRKPPAPNGALYFKATNTGDAAIALTGASSDVSAMVELHEVVMNEGMMQMRAIEGQRIEIPAGATVELKQGDLHVMAMNVVEGLENGADVEFMITTDADCTILVTAPVTVEEG